jgi:hypothetical protein
MPTLFEVRLSFILLTSPGLHTLIEEIRLLELELGCSLEVVHIPYQQYAIDRQYRIMLYISEVYEFVFQLAP